jgi:site-specific recombinase XerD
MDTVTIESVLTRWGVWQAAANLSHRTITERAAVIRHLLAFSQCGPYELTAEDIVLYTTRPGLKDSTRATYHSSIGAYHAWLVKTRRRVDNPVEETPSPKRRKGLPRPVREDDLPKIIAAANRRRTRMMVLLATLAGLRVHEVAKFSGSDIDWNNMSMIVVGKGGKTAYLPVQPLIAQDAVHFPLQGAWFPAYGRPGCISPHAVSKAIKSAMDRAGVTGQPHMLRHHYASALLRNGANLRIVQELMRHESVATTQLYTEISTEEMRAAIDKLTLLPPTPDEPLAA